MTSELDQPYYVQENGDWAEEYSCLKGPDNFECLLTEPEDRRWGRDLFNVIVRLNKQHAEVAALKAEMERLRMALKDVIDGNDLALATGRNLGSWPDSDFRRNAIKILDSKGEPHMLAQAQPEKDDVCPECGGDGKSRATRLLTNPPKWADCEACHGTGKRGAT